MVVAAAPCVYWLPGDRYGWSVRRMREHLRLAQVNPFLRLTPDSARHPAQFVDLLLRDSCGSMLAGATMLDVEAGRLPAFACADRTALVASTECGEVRVMLSQLKAEMQDFRRVTMRRNVPEIFLPTHADAPLLVTALHSALARFLDGCGRQRAPAAQWESRLANLQQRGLRPDELVHSGVENWLGSRNGVIAAVDVPPADAFNTVRLSVIAVQKTAWSQLGFVRVRQPLLVQRIKPRLPAGTVSIPYWRDPVLGYWIDRVTWSDMLGEEHAFVALTHRGQLLSSGAARAGWCSTAQAAMDLASEHAAGVLPKLSSSGKWSHIRITGGEHYREWLVALPWYPVRYASGHFEHENILLHIRCDIRESAEGGRVLLLQEVQSDWAQEARRAECDSEGAPVAAPPWLGEWPALALKLMLLHAARSGLDGLAWTTGAMQEERYDGLGASGLRLLYDRTLPFEANKLLRSLGVTCAPMPLYQPVNYAIEPADVGYVVYDARGSFVACAATWHEAEQHVPDGGRENLVSYHGLHLDETCRQAIVDNGFFAWGNGVR